MIVLVVIWQGCVCQRDAGRTSGFSGRAVEESIYDKLEAKCAPVS